eukprot:1160042-Pelagomonas_calceolata.AAC.10
MELLLPCTICKNVAVHVRHCLLLQLAWSFEAYTLGNDGAPASLHNMQQCCNIVRHCLHLQLAWSCEAYTLGND